MPYLDKINLKIHIKIILSFFSNRSAHHHGYHHSHPRYSMHFHGIPTAVSEASPVLADEGLLPPPPAGHQANQRWQSEAFLGNNWQILLMRSLSVMKLTYCAQLKCSALCSSKLPFLIMFSIHFICSMFLKIRCHLWSDRMNSFVNNRSRNEDDDEQDNDLENVNL